MEASHSSTNCVSGVSHKHCLERSRPEEFVAGWGRATAAQRQEEGRGLGRERRRERFVMDERAAAGQGSSQARENSREQCGRTGGGKATKVEGKASQAQAGGGGAAWRACLRPIPPSLAGRGLRFPQSPPWAPPA